MIAVSYTHLDVYKRQIHPYLTELAKLLYDQAQAGVAVLGVCLGSQVLARGAGAQNLIGATPEFGWCEVELTAEGRADPVLSQLPARFPIFQWHSDTFTLPPGAVHLAVSYTHLDVYKRQLYERPFHRISSPGDSSVPAMAEPTMAQELSLIHI